MAILSIRRFSLRLGSRHCFGHSPEVRDLPLFNCIYVIVVSGFTRCYARF